ncbi:MAG: hypothetical protein GX927_09245 [Lentisphaerae bacterium]|nr:hypothetical protein [Lentisphaerota bacterium]
MQIPDYQKNIPNFQWNCQRLVEELPSVPPLPASKLRRGEFPLGTLLLERGVHDLPESVQNASSEFEDFCRRLQPVTGQPEDCRTLLELRITLGKGRSRKYTISIKRGKILIIADTQFGAVRALFRIRALLRLRRASFLTPSELSSEDGMDSAITWCALKTQHTDTLDWPDAYPEGYLANLARAGYTGFHVNVQSILFCQSAVLPEFRNPQTPKHLQELNSLVELAGRWGLDVFLSLYQNPLGEDHPVFQNHPELRGSRMVGTTDRYVLCSSQKMVQEFYAQEMRNLFTAVPGLAGVFLIAGCEGWLHCHTACDQLPDGRCQCPHCRELSPEKTVAQMFQKMAEAVHEAAPYAKCVIWTYGLFAWSQNDGSEFVPQLRPPCGLMTNFDTGDTFSIFGAEGVAFDYSLRCVGPSSPFLSQQELARKNGLEGWAKSESGAPLEFCSLNGVPSLTRWERKYNGMRMTVKNALFCWKFLGYNGEFPQELAGLIAFGEYEDILRRLAHRDFGSQAASAVLRAWRHFDRAMDFHPFSNQSVGYFKGPFFIGPAQPLYLTTPKEFPEVLMKYPIGAKANAPLAMTDLTFVEPFGVQKMSRALRAMLRFWEKGVSILENLPIPDDEYQREKIKKHLALCKMYGCFLVTARNMVDFYQVRDSMKQKPYTWQDAREKYRKMREIAEQERENAILARELLQQDKALGFSFTYRYGISRKMLDYKLTHIDNLLQKELPTKLYSALFCFHQHPRLS